MPSWLPLVEPSKNMLPSSGKAAAAAGLSVSHPANHPTGKVFPRHMGATSDILVTFEDICSQLNSCLQLLFTINIQKLTHVHNSCSQLLFKTCVQIFCSQLLFTTLVQNSYSQNLFTTLLLSNQLKSKIS